MPTGGTFSTSCDESPARDDVFPARRRGRCPAPAEDGDPSPVTRDRDARARAGRPEVAPPRRGAAAADAGVRASRALPRAAGADALGGAPRARGDGQARGAGEACVPPGSAPRRERDVASDRRSGRGPARAPRGDRRRDHDQPAALDESDRRLREAPHRDPLGRRPARLGCPERRPPLREAGGAGEGEGARAGRARDRALGRCGGCRLRPDRGRGARLRPRRRGTGDPERLRLRRLRGPRVPRGRALPAHAHRQLLRQAQPEAVPAGARVVAPRGRRRALCR